MVNVVRNGKVALHYINPKDYYEGFIDPNDGTDWNQTAINDNLPSLEDFHKTVSDYLAWKVSNLIKSPTTGEDSLGKL